MIRFRKGTAKTGIPADSAAEIIGVAPQTLSSWRKRRVGPRWFRAGRLIRYRKDWLFDWIEQNASNKAPSGATGSAEPQ